MIMGFGKVNFVSGLWSDGLNLVGFATTFESTIDLALNKGLGTILHSHVGGSCDRF